jgi:hypothetical protein
MELELMRTYFPDGTNGELKDGGQLICFTIELPWRENQSNISCIPEGRYELAQRFHEHYGWHIHLLNVPGRDWILIHPATDAQIQLRGCIAPCSSLKGHGKGMASRAANDKLRTVVYEALKREKVFLTIKSKKLL